MGVETICERLDKKRDTGDRSSTKVASVVLLRSETRFQNDAPAKPTRGLEVACEKAPRKQPSTERLATLGIMTALMESSPCFAIQSLG